MRDSLVCMNSLPRDGLDVWWVNVPDIDVDAWLISYADCLSDEDIRRFHARRLPKGQAQFLFTRLVLRYLLSAYHPSVAMSEWRILRTATGRPYVSAGQSPLSFNLTHSGNRLLLAFSQFADPGIDIESRQRLLDMHGIAARYFFPAEAEQLAAQVDSGAEWFFRLWTLKEAAVKATGLGLSRALHQFEFLNDGQAGLVHRVHGDSGQNMAFWSAVHEDIVIGLACSAAPDVTLQALKPIVRELCWPGQVNDTLISWQRSQYQSRNSSTNLEP